MEREVVISMMERYANSKLSIKKVAEEYEISPSTFCRLRETAIVESWIEIETVKKMRKKGTYQNGWRPYSSRCYSRLLKDREKHEIDESFLSLEARYESFCKSYGIDDGEKEKIVKFFKEYNEAIRRSVEYEKRYSLIYLSNWF